MKFQSFTAKKPLRRKASNMNPKNIVKTNTRGGNRM